MDNIPTTVTVKMCVYSNLWRIFQIVFATIVTALTQELDSQEIMDPPTSSGLFPMMLPVRYHVRDAEYFLLEEAGQDIMRNSSTQSNMQPLVILRAQRTPVVKASYGPLSMETQVPLSFIQSVSLVRPAPATPTPTSSWRIRWFILSGRAEASSPTIRVLFYVVGRGLARGGGGRGDRKREGETEVSPCLTVFAFWQTKEVRGSCVLGGERGTCLVALALPPSWFSQSDGRSSRERKISSAGNPVEVYYQSSPHCRGEARQEASPMQRMGSVRLLQARQGSASVTRLLLGDSLLIQTSTKPLRKMDVASFYIYMRGSSNLTTFSLRATVKKGVSFRSVTPSNAQIWDITVDTSSDGSVGIICQRRASVTGKRPIKPVQILQMDFQVSDVSSQPESQLFTWDLALPDDASMVGQSEGTMKIYTCQRDFVGLAPLLMETELLNTAVLTGKRVAVPVQTVAVGSDGSVTDVSDLIECSSTDENVLKVSDRCDYVYVNGKETKGRVRMLVNLTYGYLSAQLEMKVWVPLLPLQMELSDTQLSQIKGWRIPISSTTQSWNNEEDKKGRGCMLQYQHALLRVRTHFVAEQAELREPLAYFLGSDWWVDVTKHVRYFLKVEDPSIAQLKGTVLFGRNAGTTSLKVLSPLSTSVLAERLVQVLEDRVSITELFLQPLSGLSLTLQPSAGRPRVISATATAQELLHTPKQEAVLSSWLRFSDDSITPLDIYDSTHYRLLVTSLDEAVVSVHPSLLSIVAEGEGQAKLRAQLSICEECQKSKRKSTIAMGNGSLSVQFETTGKRVNNNNNNTTTTSSSINVSIGSGRDSSSDYGSDGEEVEAERKLPAEEEQSTTTGYPGNTNTDTISTDQTYNFPNQPPANGAAGPNQPPANGDIGQNRSQVNGTAGPEGTAPGNLVNSKQPAQAEPPVWGGGAGSTQGEDVDYDDDDEDDDNGFGWPPAQRPPSDLEMGMYALLAVFCVAILLFLLNCLSYLVTFRHKGMRSRAHDPAHRHDWVWLGTDAELVMNIPGSPATGASLSTAIMDIGPGSGPDPGTPACRSSSSPASDPGVPVGARAECGETLPSPTSRRKRVQFTTFTTIGRQSPPRAQENGPGVHWVGKDTCGHAEPPLIEALEQL